jgi:hypothetical protein
MSGILQTLIASISSSVVGARDAYFNLVTLLLNTTSTNSAQNNTFLDSSSNAYSVTRNGTPIQGTYTPFSQTGWSGNFNTSTTYLTVTDTSNLRFGSANFTIEAWVYRNVAGAIQTIASKGASTPTGWVFQINAADKLVFTDTSTSITGTTSLAANTWYYVAVVRAGTGANQTTLYLNGSSDATGTSGTNFNQTTNMLIGADRSTLNFANGYISNLRLSNTNRTISSTQTTALTVDANTIFLGLNSNWFQYIDSTSAYTAMTVTGTPSVQAFSPFVPTASYTTNIVGGSGYFNGTTDYLSITTAATNYYSALGDWTWEAWVYPLSFNGPQFSCPIMASSSESVFIRAVPTSATSTNLNMYAVNSAGSPILGSAGTTAGTITINQWSHVVFQRRSGQFDMFINGNRVANNSAETSTSIKTTDTSFYIGVSSSGTSPYWNGHISGLRVTNGSALYPNVTYAVPTVPPSSTGAAICVNYINAGIYDAAAKNDLITVGNAQVKNTQAKFGTTSMSFGGAGNYLTIRDSPNLQLSTGNFTIEGWLYINTAGVAYGIVSKGAAATGWSVNITSGNKLQFSYTASNLTGTTTLSASTWYYFAVVRSGSATGNLKLYLGTSGSTTLEATSAGAVTDNFVQTSIMYVGADRVAGAAFNGYLDEIRITKGFDRTVTTTPYLAFPIQ